MNELEGVTSEQMLIIEELKRKTINDCTPKMLEDPTLFYRFSKGCNFNIRNAETVLRKTILWRKENEIDSLLADFKCPEVLENYFPLSDIGYDKDGNPIVFMSMGKIDDVGIFKSCSEADILRYLLYRVENHGALRSQQRQKTGRLNIQCVHVYDCEGITLQKATNKQIIQTVMQFISNFQNNYPEVVKAIYIINVSAYFMLFFSFVKLFITTGLISKIHFYGAEGWQEKLQEIIDADVLPAFLGGKRTDPDGNPLCESAICQGGKIPEEYYLHLSKRLLKNQKGVKQLTAERRSAIDVVIKIADPSTVLAWEFETSNRDIKFGLHFQNDGETIEIIPRKRIDTSNGPETGTHVCEKPGVYVLVFDNSYSWMYSKEIYYRAKVILPSN